MTDPNPYKTPAAGAPESQRPRDERGGKPFSILMIIVGAFFCVASFHVILRGGFQDLLVSYRIAGPFSFAYMCFYGFAGGLTSAFHLSFLICSRPKQAWGGMYAIGIALALASLAVAILECLHESVAGRRALAPGWSVFGFQPGASAVSLAAGR